MASSAANRRGIIAMLIGSALFVANDVCVRLATAGLPTGEILALRGVMASSLILAVALATAPPGALRYVFRPLVMLRGGLECGVAILYITALPLMLFADLTAIILASSLVLTGLAVIFGLEKVGVRRWLALIVGFAGVVLILRPTVAGVTLASLLAVGSTILVAMRDLVTQRVHSDTPTVMITLATTILVTCSGFLLGLTEPPWRWPTGLDATWLLAAAILVAGGNFMIIAAFRGSDVGVVSPFRYASLLYAMLTGFLIWAETPDGWSLLGGSMIVAAGVYTIWRERVRARAAAVSGLAE